MAIGFLNVEQFKRLKELVLETSGIELKFKKKKMVENRLNKRLRALGLETYEEYISVLEDPEPAGWEIGHLFDAISTNETFFFRKSEHFTVLKEHLFPEFFEERGLKFVRCWSAGCAAGQEPYSVAMAFLEYRRRHEDARLRVLATDISNDAVQAVRHGVYAGRDARGLTPRHIAGYFSEQPGGLYINDDVKRLIRSRILNLRTDKFPERQQLIYCRNVMIYFSADFRAELIERFYNSLSPGGYFFPGPSESHKELAQFFEQVKFPGTTVYRKSD